MGRIRWGGLIAGVSSTVLVLAIVAFAVFGIGPRTGAYRTLTVLSDSMVPVFRAGDVIMMTPVRTNDLKAGDVISYRAPSGDVVTHRVADIVRPGAHPVIRTKGDANGSADPWTVRIKDDTVWRQRVTIPKVGRINGVFRQSAIRAATIYGVPLVLVIAGLCVIWGRRPEDELAGFAGAWLDEDGHEPLALEGLGTWRVDATRMRRVGG